jgi:RecA/RadA recombinase
MSLLEKLSKTGSRAGGSAVLSESSFFNQKDLIPTGIPIINMAFSGELFGGFTTGLTILAGESKTFKSCLTLYALKAFQDKYKDGVCLFYDCEYGITPQYLKSFGIDATRILHIPIEHVEHLKFDMAKKLENITRKDNIFIMVDSLGNLASKKEVEDAENEKSVADMSRAKAIRSFFRITTPHIAQKNIPCFVINHVYKEQGLFPKTIIPGGSAVEYSANQIFVISKAQEKDGTDVTGYKFTLNVHKSRFVKEKSKFAFSVNMTSGINKWSSLLEIALELGWVVKPSNGWYSRKISGEIETTKHRAKDTNSLEFWKPIISDKDFQKLVTAKYKYGSDIQTEYDMEALDSALEDDVEELMSSDE